MIYLDNNATTRPADEVVEAMREMLASLWANPSSVHRAGQAARQRVELARQSVAELIGAQPRDLIFTSGATESIDLAFRGVLGAFPAERRREPINLVTTAVEHEAVRDLLSALREELTPWGGGFEVRHLPLDPSGRADASALPALVDVRTALVSVQWANNETGVIHPIEAIGRCCRERRVPFHCDGTQWVGKMPTLVDASGGVGAPIDLLSFSAHKMHGPKGVGALYARRGVRLVPRLRGVQERERRGGTENVPGIVGFGMAAELAQRWLADEQARIRLGELRNQFEQGVLHAVPHASINGADPLHPERRLWNTTNIAFPKLEAEALLLLLSESADGGLAASAGAACSSGSLDPSPVLLAMGVSPERAHGSVRFSLSRETTEEEIARAVPVVVGAVRKLMGASSAAVGAGG